MAVPSLINLPLQNSPYLHDKVDTELEPTLSPQATVLSKRRPLALYLFAGSKRKADVSHYLSLQGWDTVEMDILRSKDHDLSIPSIAAEVLCRTRQAKFQALLGSPPCDTFSRVKYANTNGPAPQRSASFLRGFSWLRGDRLKAVRIANALTDFAFEAFGCQVVTCPGIAFLEFPEDLGAVTSGKFAGSVPASIWQFPKFAELLELPGVQTGALRQQDFGTLYIKPTRLIFKAAAPASDPKIFWGPPKFDSLGCYLGPVPKLPYNANTVTLARGPGEVGFRTTGTAAWPPQLCEWIATACTTALPADGVPHGDLENEAGRDCIQGAVDVEDAKLNINLDSRQAPFPVTVPPAGFWIGGKGPPRTTYLLGKTREFHDGCGLTSPGRWRKKDRVFPSAARWTVLRNNLEKVLVEAVGEKGIQHLALTLACKPENSPFLQPLIDAGRDVIHDWLAANTGDYRASRCNGDVAPGQPFLLNMVHFLLREMVDADFAIVKTMEIGVTAGILHPLPRTPAVYEEQVKWRLKQDPLLSGVLIAENYSSIEKHLDAVELLFKADEKEGLMQ